MWRLNDPQCNESAKIKYDIVPYTRGKGLDIGCGQYKAYSHFIGIDNGKQYGGKNVTDINGDGTDLSLFADDSLDFVFSSHFLEHVEDYKSALKEWWRVIKPDGYLVLYLPHKDLYPNIGEEGANPDHKHDYHPDDIKSAMHDLYGWDLLINEVRDQDNGPGEYGNEYSFFQVYQKRHDKAVLDLSLEVKPHKTACVVRYGGFGDQIMASTVLPGLKEQGYHVIYMTTPSAKQVVEHDPNIDEFILQDKDQVPNQELPNYWAVWEKKFNKFINLSESVEGTFLAMPGRASHRWPDHVRHKMMNVNYLEFMHWMADVPLPPKAKFHPTKEEKRWAMAERNKMGSKVVLWALAGSSVHKKTPWTDQVIAKLMIEYKNVDVVMVGDGLCQILETGWENEKRVHRRSGKWTIRESMTFARYADVVVGPETGILNAVGLEPIPKVIWLSHSSPENLTKYWPNCLALVPDDCPCHPCHRLHYTWDYCHKIEVDIPGGGQAPVSLCTANIPGEAIFAMIQEHLDKKEAA
jgi:ADP-heptose:LPS heptosyltransferase/predicted SAM-dependent methyltransferase